MSHEPPEAFPRDHVICDAELERLRFENEDMSKEISKAAEENERLRAELAEWSSGTFEKHYPAAAEVAMVRKAEARALAAEARVEVLTRIGSEMSNVCFNLSCPDRVFTKVERASCADLQRQWDAALSAPTPTPAPEPKP